MLKTREHPQDEESQASDMNSSEADCTKPSDLIFPGTETRDTERERERERESYLPQRLLASRVKQQLCVPGRRHQEDCQEEERKEEQEGKEERQALLSLPRGNGEEEEVRNPDRRPETTLCNWRFAT